MLPHVSELWDGEVEVCSEGRPAGSERVESSPSSTQGSAGALRQKNCFLALKAIHKPLFL